MLRIGVVGYSPMVTKNHILELIMEMENAELTVVCKKVGRAVVFVNKITGTKARDLYEILKGEENGTT